MVYIILPLISAIFVSSILFIVIRQYSKLNIIFSLFCIATIIWLFGTFMMFISSTNEGAVFWDRFVYIGVVFMPTICYHFGSTLIKIVTKRKIIIVLSYILSVFFLVISRTELFISGVNRYSWGVHSQAKIFHHVFLINFVF